MREASLNTFTDIKQFDDFRKKVNTDLNAIEKNSISKMSYRAGQDFSNYTKKNRQAALRQIEYIVWRKEVEFQRNETGRQYTNLFERMASAGFSVEDMYKNPSLDVIEDGMAPYWRAGELEEYRDQMLVGALVNVGRYDDARNLAKSTEVFTPTEKTAILKSIDIAERTKAAKLKIAQEEYINAEQGRLIQLARKGQLTEDIIQASKLDEFGLGSKDTFYTMLDDWAKAVLKDKEALFKESNPEVEARILEEIRDPRSKITPKDISALVGKGLSIDDADRFINRMDVYKGFWFGRADRFLKDQLGWSDTYTKFTHPEGGISYHAAMNQLFTDIETQDLKDKDIYERAIETGIPYIVDYWSNVLSLEKPQIERMTLMLRGKPTPKKKTEPVGPLREQPEIKLEYDPLGIFK